MVTSYFSDVIRVTTTAETQTFTVSQTMYIITVSTMGSVIAFLVVCCVLLVTVLLCRYVQHMYICCFHSGDNVHCLYIYIARRYAWPQHSAIEH